MEGNGEVDRCQDNVAHNNGALTGNDQGDYALFPGELGFSESGGSSGIWFAGGAMRRSGAAQSGPFLVAAWAYEVGGAEGRLWRDGLGQKTGRI